MTHLVTSFMYHWHKTSRYTDPNQTLIQSRLWNLVLKDSFFHLLLFSLSWFLAFVSTAGWLDLFWAPPNILSLSLSLSPPPLSFMYVSIYSPADASPICTSLDTPAGALLRDAGATANPDRGSWINLTLGEHQQIMSYRTLTVLYCSPI